jgi:ParB/RepB/Spo0J family partition protein
MAKELKLLYLDVGEVIPTPDNTRVIDETAPAFVELVASIKAQGVRMPVHVRPHPDKKGKWDLRAGARRLAAAKIAGLKTIPAVVDDGQTDADAEVLTVTENDLREGLTALESGAAIARLYEAFNGDMKAVQKATGKGPTYLAQRRQIHVGLAEVWRKAVTKATSPFAKWSARHLEAIARMPQGVQEQLLGQYASDGPDADQVRLEDLQDRLVKMIRPVSKAPWNPDDEGVVAKAGACTVCVKRSSVQPDLFEEPVKGKAVDRCLDCDCWAAKATAFCRREAARLTKEHGAVVLVESESGSPWAEQQEAKKVFGNFLGRWQYSKATAGSKGARAALVVCGDGAGKTMWIAPERRDNGAKVKAAGPRSLAERKKGLEMRRWAEVIDRLADKVGNLEAGDLVAKDKGSLVMLLAAAYGSEADEGEVGEWDDVAKAMKAKDAPAKALDALWQGVRPNLLELLQHFGPAGDGVIQEAKDVAALFDIDLKAIYETVSKEKGFRVPKSWASEMRDAASSSHPRRGSKDGKQAAHPEACKTACAMVGQKDQCKECKFVKKVKKADAAGGAS